MVRLSHIVFLALALLLMLSACATSEKSERRGDAALALGEYAEAAGQYRRAYNLTAVKDKPRRALLQYKMAECFRAYGYTARALGAYRSAEHFGLTDTLTLLRQGDMFRYQGDYKSAARAYEQYLETHPNDEAAQRGLAACDEAARLKAEGSAWTVKQEALFNGTRADYSPAWLPGDVPQLYFSTTRRQVTGDDLSGVTGDMPGDIWFAKQDERGNWLRPQTVEGDLNTDYDEGACAFSADGKTMYLTMCRTDPEYPRMAEIWTSQRSDAAWGKPQFLKLTADTLSSYAHPAPSADGNWLYFVSDMPGGYGGYDIWRVPLTGHGVGAVENLGPDINTAGNEMFPTVRPNGELYFSTDGRGGMGGLDLYCAYEDTLTQHWSVEHLPAPMNSQGDDFGMTFEGTHKRGFFSSNRSTGGRGWDKIYSFSYPEMLHTVKGWVYERDGYELPEAQVYMVGDDGTNEKLGVLSDGSFEHEVTPGVNYVFLAVCKDYLSVQNELRADHTTTEEYQYVLQFPLPSMNIPVLVRGIFYEFGKADLLPESIDALNRLVGTLKENPHITIELAAHTDYVSSDTFNLGLSWRRAQRVVDYLIAHDVDSARLVACGYGEAQPKVVTKKLAETYTFLHEGDTLTEAYILQLDSAQQAICNALNRRTEFRVLTTTYGLLDQHGNLLPPSQQPAAATRREDEADRPDDEEYFYLE
ncbi:MAG: OmpA family protein [Bacteroidaceae bacterium]|nr:OmpA family protein [Bacteroidaceae bacterium]